MDVASSSKSYVSRPGYRALPWISLIVLLATYPLVVMGGLVTSKDAGLSVPDWPDTYGYNLFLFPPSMWIGGIFYEHVHRLLGALVGLLAIIQTVIAWRSRFPLWVKLLTTSVLASVIIQGVIGGLRVTEINIHLAVLHGIFGQIVLCQMAMVCVVASKWWRTISATDPVGLRKVFVAACVVCGLFVGQLTIGAMMRHYGGGLAIPDIPLAYGTLVPPISQEGLAEANRFRIALADPTLGPVNLNEIWMHFGHRVGAVLVLAGVIWLAVLSHRHAREIGKVNGLARLLVALVVLQIGLGIYTVLDRKPVDITTLHQTMGAICLMVVTILTVRAYRLTRVGRAASREEVVARVPVTA